MIQQALKGITGDSPSMRNRLSIRAEAPLLLALRFGLHRVREVSRLIAALVFGDIHSLVCIFHQLISIPGILRIKGDAYAG